MSTGEVAWMVGVGGGVDGRVSTLAISLRGLFCFHLFPARWVPRLTSLRKTPRLATFTIKVWAQRMLLKKNSPGLI